MEQTELGGPAGVIDANDSSPQLPEPFEKSAIMATNNSPHARQQLGTNDGMVGLGLGPGLALEAQAVQQRQTQPPDRQPCPFATVSTRYNKLSKGDAGYGGDPFSPSPLISSTNKAGPTGPHVAIPEGLLSKKLRSLGVKSPGGRQNDDA